MTSGAAYCLRIYVNANEYQRGKPLYELIVQTARPLSLAGTSVFSVEMSFGAPHQVHDAQSDYEFLDLPVVIEMVDEAEPIEALFAELGGLFASTVVDVEPVRVVPVSSRESS
jgi:PII-like signaling protein